MLLTNMLLKDEKGNLERIVYTDDIICYTISLTTNEMPTKKLVSSLKAAIQNGTLHICMEEKVSPIEFDKLSDKQKEMTDRTYEIVSDVIDGLKDNLFNKELRGKVVKEVAQKFCITMKSVYKYLKRYWQGGMNKLALVPQFVRCGAKGQDREPCEQSLGRKRDDGTESFKVTEKVKKCFKNCLDKYFYSHKRLSLVKCYLLMLNEYFSDVLDKVGQYPSFGQFRYYFDKTRDFKKEYCKRLGEKEYNQKHREIVGNSNFNTVPATVQIDSTEADFYLVSQYDRSKLVGRPIITIATDVVSREVVGIAIGFESPSWKTTMLVLSNIAADKVEYCKQFGIEINQEEWPIANMMPNIIVSDKGPEFFNSNMQQVIDTLGITVEYSPSHRPDLKAVVERFMGTVQSGMRGFIEGEVSDDIRKKANKFDYRMNASLTLHEFTQLIILAVLQHNNHQVLGDYKRSEDMIIQNVEPIPLKLWNYSQENLLGYNYVDSNYVNLCVMPQDKATVTAKGIMFKGILYGCEKGLEEQWFVRARNFGNYTIEVSYNPSSVNEIYVHTEDSYEVATVLEYQDAFKGKSYEEVLILLKSERNLMRELKEEHLKDKVEYIAEIQKITDVNAIKTEESKAEKLKDIKLNKETEIIMNNQVAKVVPIVAKKETIDDTKEIDTEANCEEQEEVYESALDKFIKNKLNKVLKKDSINK